MLYTLKDATVEDTAFAHRLHERCYRPVFVRQFGAWDAVLHERNFRAKWCTANFQIIVCDGNAVGVLSVWRGTDHLFLAELQIDPSAQGRGIGTAVIRDQLAAAHASGLPVCLQVLRQNPALRLYERLGFVRVAASLDLVFMEARPPANPPSAGLTCPTRATSEIL